MQRMYQLLGWKKSPTELTQELTLAERLKQIQFPQEKIPTDLVSHFMLEETAQKKCKDKTIHMQCERFVQYQKLLFKHKNELDGSNNNHLTSFSDIKKNHQSELETLIKHQCEQIETNYKTIETRIHSSLDENELNPSPESKEADLKYYFGRLNSFEEEKRRLLLGEKDSSNENELIRRIILLLEENSEETKPQLADLLNEFDKKFDPNNSILIKNKWTTSDSDVFMQQLSKLDYSVFLRLKNSNLSAILGTVPQLEIESPLTSSLRKN